LSVLAEASARETLLARDLAGRSRRGPPCSWVGTFSAFNAHTSTIMQHLSTASLSHQSPAVILSGLLKKQHQAVSCSFLADCSFLHDDYL